MLVNNTPIEEYLVNGVPVLVKREDLCCPSPGPAFSKIRGVYAHLRNRPEQIIGVLDTFHSKAGWAVSYVCAHLGKQTVCFWPRYKNIGDVLQPQQLEVLKNENGASLVALPAGRSAILYYQAKKLLQDRASSYLMPNALKLSESITENAEEVQRTLPNLPTRIGTLIISISSGTVAAGIIRGFHRTIVHSIVLHMGYSRSLEAAKAYIERSSEVPLDNVSFVDEGYSYSDSAKGVSAPFPCNQFYDLKAWKWLHTAIEKLQPPVLFWNIGE